MRLALIAYGLGILGSSAHAFEVEHVESKYQDKEFHLSLTVVLDAPADRVASVVRDYRKYPRLDARILEAKVLSRDAPDQLLLYTKLRACFGVFCRNVKRVERVHEGEHELEATVLPEQSEIVKGETRTELTPLGQRTRVSYTTGIAPGFWVPAFGARSLMLHTLRDASVELFRNVERQAQEASK